MNNKPVYASRLMTESFLTNAGISPVFAHLDWTGFYCFRDCKPMFSGFFFQVSTVTLRNHVQ